jgi:ribosomal protein L27
MNQLLQWIVASEQAWSSGICDQRGSQVVDVQAIGIGRRRTLVGRSDGV